MRLQSIYSSLVHPSFLCTVWFLVWLTYLVSLTASVCGSVRLSSPLHSLVCECAQVGALIRALRKIERLRYTAEAVEIWNGMDLYRTGSFGELGGGRDYSFNG